MLLRIRIRNFKSIDLAEIDLAPLTLLLGPPASGKSNLLDALAFAGYFNRFLLLDREYGNSASNFEPPTLVLRFNVHEQLFRHHDLTKKVNIEITDGEKHTVFSMGFEGGRFLITINNVNIPWDLKNLSLAPNVIQGIRSSLSQVAKGKFVESRLYGYDRYGLASSTCTAPAICGFHMHLKKQQERPFPRNIMSEFGWNASLLIKTVSDVIINLNDTIMEHLGEKVEIKVLRSGLTAIFDYHYEIDTQTVSDSMFRALYYLMALRTAMNYIKLHGLEKRFILMLEEPEAHLFPFFINLLVKYVMKTIKLAYVVITTHNPILVSALWDKVKETRTYYVYRDRKGSTRACEIDIEKLAKEMKTVEELLFMTPKDVLSKFTIRRKAYDKAKE